MIKNDYVNTNYKTHLGTSVSGKDISNLYIFYSLSVINYHNQYKNVIAHSKKTLLRVLIFALGHNTYYLV